MAETAAEDRIDPKVIKIAVALIVGSLAVSFDTTIISVALYTLSVQLHASIATIQWVSTGYLLALGVSGSARGLGTGTLRRQARLDVCVRSLSDRLNSVQPVLERQQPHRLPDC